MDSAGVGAGVESRLGWMPAKKVNPNPNPNPREGEGG